MPRRRAHGFSRFQTFIIYLILGLTGKSIWSWWSSEKALIEPTIHGSYLPMDDAHSGSQITTIPSRETPTETIWKTSTRTSTRTVWAQAQSMETESLTAISTRTSTVTVVRATPTQSTVRTDSVITRWLPFGQLLRQPPPGFYALPDHIPQSLPHRSSSGSSQMAMTDEHQKGATLQRTSASMEKYVPVPTAATVRREVESWVTATVKTKLTSSITSLPTTEWIWTPAPTVTVYVVDLTVVVVIPVQRQRPALLSSPRWPGMGQLLAQRLPLPGFYMLPEELPDVFRHRNIPQVPGKTMVNPQDGNIHQVQTADCKLPSHDRWRLEEITGRLRSCTGKLTELHSEDGGVGDFTDHAAETVTEFCSDAAERLLRWIYQDRLSRETRRLCNSAKPSVMAAKRATFGFSKRGSAKNPHLRSFFMLAGVGISILAIPPVFYWRKRLQIRRSRRKAIRTQTALEEDELKRAEGISKPNDLLIHHIPRGSLGLDAGADEVPSRHRGVDELAPSAEMSSRNQNERRKTVSHDTLRTLRRSHRRSSSLQVMGEDAPSLDKTRIRGPLTTSRSFDGLTDAGQRGNTHILSRISRPLGPGTPKL